MSSQEENKLITDIHQALVLEIDDDASVCFLDKASNGCRIFISLPGADQLKLRITLRFDSSNPSGFSASTWLMTDEMYTSTHHKRIGCGTAFSKNAGYAAGSTTNASFNTLESLIAEIQRISELARNNQIVVDCV